jgi:hypothetical protein
VERLNKKFLSVKFLVTIALTLVFCYLSVIGKISAEQFMTVFSMVVGFYFSQSIAKKENN